MSRNISNTNRFPENLKIDVKESAKQTSKKHDSGVDFPPDITGSTPIAQQVCLQVFSCAGGCWVQPSGTFWAAICWSFTLISTRQTKTGKSRHKGAGERLVHPTTSTGVCFRRSIQVSMDKLKCVRFGTLVFGKSALLFSAEGLP